MFQIGLPYYPRLNSSRSVSIKCRQNEKAFSRKIGLAYYLRLNSSWSVSIKCWQNEQAFFPKYSRCMHVSWNIVSSVSFCFQDANYAYATQQGILTKIRACEHLQKFCEHEQESRNLIFARNLSKGQILQALSNWMGPFDNPSIDEIPFWNPFSGSCCSQVFLRITIY